MQQHYEKITDYLVYLQQRHNVQICIKDFCGFIPINKELDAALQPFLAHTNLFCMFMKSDREHYHTCLRMIRKMYEKCERTGHSFFGYCHAGLGEYVIPIRSGDILIGSINAGFFQNDPELTAMRICATCRCSPPLDEATALRLYSSCIHSATVDVDEMLMGLELLAEYLGQTYRLIRQTHAAPAVPEHYQGTSEDEILTHAVDYIRRNIGTHISVSELAEHCFCSDSYLSRIFKRRTGVPISTYINKTRMELAKNYLTHSTDNMADIAQKVGLSDPNYFSRVFTQIIGIPPTEYRRRFQSGSGEAPRQLHGK